MLENHCVLTEVIVCKNTSNERGEKMSKLGQYQRMTEWDKYQIAANKL